MTLIQFTGYFQTKADQKLWKALPNKTQWLHDKLNDTQAKPTQNNSNQEVLDDAEAIGGATDGQVSTD